MKEQLKVLRDHIKSQGLKQTSQREVILRHFLALPDFLTVDEIGRAVHERDHRIGLSTVYRSLKLFTDCGLARELRFWHGKTCYEKSFNVSPHNYLVCTACHRVQAFSDPLVEAVRDKVSQGHRFKPAFNRLEIYGLCEACRGPQDEDED